jgi:hypothetical protein
MGYLGGLRIVRKERGSVSRLVVKTVESMLVKTIELVLVRQQSKERGW